jgi:hypothetical protein
METITAKVTGMPTSSLTIGCPMPLGFLMVTNPPNPPAVNLGQGNFVPTQLIVSSDGSMAYVIAKNLASVLTFNIGNQTSHFPIALSGSAMPLQVSLTPDGTLLYVGANDGKVHVVDTVTFADIQQISFPQNPGLCSGVTFTCNPDLIAVKP